MELKKTFLLHKLIINIVHFAIVQKGNVIALKADYFFIMKKCLIILGLFFFSLESFAIEKIYIQQPPVFNNQIYKRPVYSPYSNMYYSPYRYRKTNYNDAKRIQRINRIRHLNRIRNNIVSWNLNRNKNGIMTGYSTPINQNIYNQFGQDFWDTNKIAPNCTTDLFSTPSAGGSYHKRGEWINRNGGVSSKTGVRIIYD